MRRILFISFATLMLSVTTASPQEAIPVDDSNCGWYVGAEGGVSFGFGSFSSFGYDKTRAGYNIGLYGGYRFNPILSAELSAKWGQTLLSAHGCCIDASYWLGADGMRYYAPVSGLPGWNYADLKSCVYHQQYGARLNVNLLGFIESTKSSRWTLDVSPAVYAVGTKAKLKTNVDDQMVMEYGSKWHFGYGGRVQAGYMMSRNLSVGLYSEFTALTGSRLDGVTESYHDDNFIWESGIRIGWTFGKSGKKKAVAVSSAVAPAESLTSIQEASVEEIIPQQQSAVVVDSADKQEEKTAVETNNKEIVFPVIYFDFNKTDIKSGEMIKLRDIYLTLSENPDMMIQIKGWTDLVGSTAVNKRISLRRAEAVKVWLVSQGIDAMRIEVLGMGIDYDEPNAANARRVDVTDIEGKEAQQ